MRFSVCLTHLAPDRPLDPYTVKSRIARDRPPDTWRLQAQHFVVVINDILGRLTATFSTASLALWLRRPPREQEILGSNLACTGIFLGSSHTSDSKIGAPVATLPGAWRYRVSAGTGRPGVSIL